MFGIVNDYCIRHQCVFGASNDPNIIYHSKKCYSANRSMIKSYLFLFALWPVSNLASS